jgi:hypothetical protein
MASARTSSRFWPDLLGDFIKRTLKRTPNLTAKEVVRELWEFDEFDEFEGVTTQDVNRWLYNHDEVLADHSYSPPRWCLNKLRTKHSPAESNPDTDQKEVTLPVRHEQPDAVLMIWDQITMPHALNTVHDIFESNKTAELMICLRDRYPMKLSDGRKTIICTSPDKECIKVSVVFHLAVWLASLPREQPKRIYAVMTRAIHEELFGLVAKFGGEMRSYGDVTELQRAWLREEAREK